MEMGPRIITDGLILALDAADQGSYPGAGTTWNDLSSNGFNGTLVGGVGYSNTGFGSMVLDGVNDRIESPSVNTMGGIRNQTLEIWIKSSGVASGQSSAGLVCPDYGQTSSISNSPSAGSVKYELKTTDYPPGTPGTGSPVTLVNFTAPGASGVNCFDNRWHHIACTRNDTDAVIYIDGISRASTSGGGAWSGGTQYSAMNTQIGHNPNDNTLYHLIGNIGLARIYNKALTAAEVLQNYKALKPRFKLN